MAFSAQRAVLSAAGIVSLAFGTASAEWAAVGDYGCEIKNVDEVATWFHAVRHCHEEEDGAELVTVASAADAELVKAVTGGTPSWVMGFYDPEDGWSRDFGKAGLWRDGHAGAFRDDVHFCVRAGADDANTALLSPESCAAKLPFVCRRCPTPAAYHAAVPGELGEPQQQRGRRAATSTTTTTDAPQLGGVGQLVGGSSTTTTTDAPQLGGVGQLVGGSSTTTTTDAPQLGGVGQLVGGSSTTTTTDAPQLGGVGQLVGGSSTTTTTAEPVNGAVTFDLSVGGVAGEEDSTNDGDLDAGDSVDVQDTGAGGRGEPESAAATGGSAAATVALVAGVAVVAVLGVVGAAVMRYRRRAALPAAEPEQKLEDTSAPELHWDDGAMPKDDADTTSLQWDNDSMA